MSAPLIGHQIVTTPLLPPPAGQLYDYLLGGNGLFLRAAREGLAACIPIGPGAVRGLPAVAPYVALAYPRVPAAAVRRMLDSARSAEHGGHPVEILFHLEWRAARQRWFLQVPAQDQSAGHCRPLDAGPDSSFARALIEVHSHHNMRAFWSGTDDADEGSGFRLYGVLGTIFRQPALRLRVGLHGYFWEIPAGWIFALPPEFGGDADDCD